jgi:hypothetical protein
MGNCKSNHEDVEDVEEVAMKVIPEVKKKVHVLTFAGPEAVTVEIKKNLQPTFSDPVFFSPRNRASSSFKLDD